METNYVGSDSFEFTSLKEIVIQLLKNTGYLVDLSTTGIATGFDQVDKLTKGFQPGELSVVATKPGNGKTAFLLSLLFNIGAKSGKTVGIFSPERSSAKLFYRLIESETGYAAQKIMTRDLKDSEKEQVNAVLYSLSKAEILVDDTARLRKEAFQKRCKQLRNKFGVDIILVDGFELLSYSEMGEEANMEEQKSTLQDIKDMAQELKVPIVVFTRMSKTNTLATHPATIDNVADYVAQIADSILLVHRQGIGDKADMVIVKHPNITTEVSLPLKFIESIDKFVDR